MVASRSKKMHIERVGPYKLGKTIGQGTYGKVKLASHIETGEKAAIKIIEKSQLQLRKNRDRLKREIKFLRLLHHPNIVRVYDVQEADGCIYIIMEYASGGELFDYIVAHVRVKEDEARCFFRQVLSAIDYCHKNAVIHRDLKPENLLLDDRKTIKIIDFGFGNNFNFDNLLETFCGSPFYAAPEMILGKKYEGPEVDLWSLGVILFALLCGHLPFDDENIKDLYRKIANGLYSCPDYVSPKARHLIERLIQVDPRSRATLSEVLHHPWVNEGYDTIPSSYMAFRPLIKDVSQLDQSVVAAMQSFGWKKETFERDWLACQNLLRPSPMRATYWLIKEMRERKAGENRRRSQHPSRSGSLHEAYIAPGRRDTGANTDNSFCPSPYEGGNLGIPSAAADMSMATNDNCEYRSADKTKALSINASSSHGRGEAGDYRQEYHHPAQHDAAWEPRAVANGDLSKDGKFNICSKRASSSSGKHTDGGSYGNKKSASSNENDDVAAPDYQKAKNDDGVGTTISELPKPLRLQPRPAAPKIRAFERKDGGDKAEEGETEKDTAKLGCTEIEDEGRISSVEASFLIREYIQARLESDLPSIEQSSKTKVNKSGKIDYSSPPVGGSTLPYSSDDSKMKNEQKHYKDGAIIAADPSHASNHTDVRYSVSPSGGPPAPSGAAGISESNYDFSVSNAARPISRIDAGDEFAVVDSRKKENDPQSADRGIKKKAHPGDSLKLLTARTKAETINLTKAIPERLFSQPKKTCNDSNKHPDNPSHVKSTQAAEFTTTNKEPSTPGDEDLNSGTKISPIQDKKIPHNLNIAISHYKQNPPSKSKDTIGTGSIFSKVSQKSKNITSAGFQSAHSGDNYDHRAKASENGAPVADNFVYKSQKGSTGRPSDKRPLLDIPAPAAKLQQIPCDVQSHTVTDPDEEPHASPMRQQLAQKGTNDARTDLCDMPSAVEQSGVKDNISANEDAVSDNTQPRFAPSSSITPPATPGPGKRFSWFRRLSNSIKESQNNNKGNMARYNKS